MIKTTNRTIIKVLQLDCKSFVHAVEIDFVNDNITARGENNEFLASYILTKTRINNIERVLNTFQLK